MKLVGLTTLALCLAAQVSQAFRPPVTGRRAITSYLPRTATFELRKKHHHDHKVLRMAQNEVDKVLSDKPDLVETLKLQTLYRPGTGEGVNVGDLLPAGKPALVVFLRHLG